jgi:hypothetical protein
VISRGVCSSLSIRNLTELDICDPVSNRREERKDKAGKAVGIASVSDVGLEKPSFANSIKYMIVLPKWWFFKTYIRHRGYTDGFPGFVFSLFSSIRYWITYIKLCEITD